MLIPVNDLFSIAFHESFKLIYKVIFVKANLSVAEQLNIKWTIIFDILQFLSDHKLIQPLSTMDRVTGHAILTPRGFDVAVDNEQQETSEKIRKGILWFTGIVAVSAVAQIIYYAFHW